MASINIKNLEELIQKKAYAVTSSTPSVDLSAMVEASLLATNSIRQYDSDGALPTASTSNDKIAFVLSDKSIRFNNGTKWDSLASGAAQATLPFVWDGTNGLAQNGGEISGYVFGGNAGGDIEKFSFTSDANSTDVSDISEAHYWGDAASSTTAGYRYGGEWGSPLMSNIIEKITYSTEGNATDVGDLTVPARFAAPAQSSTHGYCAGGSTPGITDTIQKFSFSSDGNAADAGDLNSAQDAMTGSSSPTHGYGSGGRPDSNAIRKWPFASDTGASDVGDMTGPAQYAASGGEQTYTHGYINRDGGPSPEGIEKFPFSTDANSTDVADVSSAYSFQAASCNSLTHGYYAGGGINVIQKYDRTADTDTTDVGDLTVTEYGQSGTSI